MVHHSEFLTFFSGKTAANVLPLPAQPLPPSRTHHFDLFRARLQHRTRDSTDRCDRKYKNEIVILRRKNNVTAITSWSQTA